MAGKCMMRSKEEKLAIVKRNLAGETSRSLERETGCSHRLIQEWTRKYLAEGEAGLEVKKKPVNPLSRYERRNELTYEEQLQYQIELLKRELVKKEAEVLRLKKRNERKGGDARKRRSERCMPRFKSRQTNILSANFVKSTVFLAAATTSG